MNESYTMDRDTAIKLYDFIRNHLEVVNDEPVVEQLMLDLEETFNLGEDE